MAKNSITDYSKTASLNTDIQSVDIDEGCLPSGINNAIREIMADLAAVNDGTVSLTSPSFAAASLTGDLSFGDNDKAIFGAGSDLQIYHTGSDSVIADSGTGNLNILGDADVAIINAASTEYKARFITDGAVELYHNGSLKLATTATGIDVTGEVTADKLTVQNSGTTFLSVGSTGGSGAILRLDGSSNGDFAGGDFSTISNISNKLQIIGGTPNAPIELQTHDGSGNKLRQTIASNGDISFYEDTGTTAKFFWDASAESLQLGSIGPQTPATFNLRSYGANIEFGHGNRTSGYFGTLGASANNGLPYLGFSAYADGGAVNTFSTKGFKGNVIQNDTAGNLTFNQLTNANATGQNLTERMRIDSSGNLLVGTTDTTLYNNSGSGNGGISLSMTSAGNGRVDAARDGTCYTANRLGSDGFIFDFRRDGTTVGSIGTNSGTKLYIGAGDAAFRFDPDNDSVRPHNASTNGSTDNFLNLGTSSNRFKDLYLGGGLRADTLTFSNLAGSERMTITSAGLVGINTSSPIYDLQVGTYGSDADSTLALASTSTGTGSIRFGDGTSGGEANAGKIVYDHSNNGMQFHTVAAERMRIDSSGKVLVGKTSSSISTVGVELGVGYSYFTSSGINQYVNRTSDGETIRFFRSGAQVGSITVSTSATAYNTSSDYRLKENVTGITDGIERVKQLNPSRFNFIVDADKTVDGFLAHEAATVVPEAVTGEKDAIDADGNPEYQGIDQSKLVPLLTAALQEAITKIEDLEARVATLEGN